MGEGEATPESSHLPKILVLNQKNPTLTSEPEEKEHNSRKLPVH